MRILWPGSRLLCSAPCAEAEGPAWPGALATGDGVDAKEDVGAMPHLPSAVAQWHAPRLEISSDGAESRIP